ncbi:response regulator transcription factor [Pelosinus propionicus]|uniref:DNA-binding response regulator, OmpR family, contains REC and winged-helix (WHTH) domain n=1 Tax=Pelosinus propionicus DSM 13327 TaxID=1123291 RepID=A0A1I4MAC3_9FIRM|nr:response regulator transcription factor [Pelosinus propionicus]SFM00033.1 DNA-binding response regulator, OmpR family, contains REC and winged-helix (wHTH) domain [Pelosinus propionicus DSM 13327]
MVKILIADDEQDIRDIVTWYLSREGFEVFTAADGHAAVDIETAHLPDLLILDVMMPGLSGWEIAKAVQRNVPIIFLTALNAENDKINGFKLGADDYIVKPFSPRELVARVHAVLRRTGKLALPGDVLQVPPLSLEPGTQRVMVNEQTVELSAKEFELLYFLVRHPHTIFTRENLLVNLWGYDFEGDERTVDTTIKRVRRKIGIAGDFIKTVRGSGYKFGVDQS